MNEEILQTIVGAALRLAGVPQNVADVVGRAVPRVLAWVRVAIDQGHDADAELEAMLDTADMVAEDAEAAKFGETVKK